jgi:tetratricopeptide (TPR) repeat protein
VPSKLRSLFRRSIAPLFLAIALLGCGGAYAEAIARGNQFADAAQWDEAAAAYEEAMRIDPEDPEAKIKLKEVRRKQSAERLQRAKALEARGELAQALAMVQQAAKFDDSNVEAQKALTRITEAVLDKAQKLYKKEKLRDAFELTSLVLKGAKNHPRARELDDRVRSALAEKSFERAKAFMDKDKMGNAMVELAACLTYRADYPDAKLHFGQVKLKLEQQLRFTVVLDKFKGDGRSVAMTRVLNPDLLQQSIDERLLLSVVDKKPTGDDLPNGVVLHGAFADYQFNSSNDKAERSCDYVCGKTERHNPEIDRLRGQLGQAESELSRVQGDVSRKEQDLLKAEQKVTKEEQEAQGKQADVDKARQRVDDCRAKAPPEKSSPCNSEDSNLRSKQSYLDSARRDVDSARRDVARYRSDVQSIKSRTDNARRTIEQTNSKLKTTPTKIYVDKICPHRYQVTKHKVWANLTVKLSVDELGEDKSIISNQPFKYDTVAADESFAAQQGRCREIASGNPKELPSEKDLRKTLTTKIIKDLRKKVLASYDAYRRSFLTAARRHEAAGLTDQATEAYVRYVLTGPHQLEDKKKLGDFFNKTKGIGKLDSLWSL